jgi:cytochrome P450
MVIMLVSALPSGWLVLMSQYLVHRHPALWEQPERFEPERFTPERSKGRPSSAYFPFGGGQRTCIGAHMAMLEAQPIVARVAQGYRLRLAPGHVVEPVAEGTLRPRHGLRMTVQPR